MISGGSWDSFVVKDTEPYLSIHDCNHEVHSTSYLRKALSTITVGKPQDVSARPFPFVSVQQES